MKVVPYLAILISYFSLAVFAQSETAYLVSGTGGFNGNGNENQMVPTSTGHDGFNNPQQTGSFPPSNTQSFPSNGDDENRNGDNNSNGNGNENGNSNGNNNPNGNGNGNGNQKGNGGWDDDDDDDDGFLGFGGNDDDDNHSTTKSGWTPVGSENVPGQTSGPNSNNRSGHAGSDGYITTTLTIAIPVPLDSNNIDPSETASIEGQSGGASNVKAHALAVSLAVVGAVTGAILM